MIAFDYWMRTGLRLRMGELLELAEKKFNPYHDPDNGRFTFATDVFGVAIASADRIVGSGNRNTFAWESQFTSAIYEESGRTDKNGNWVHFISSSPKIYPGLKARFRSENATAQKRLMQEWRK